MRPFLITMPLAAAALLAPRPLIHAPAVAHRGALRMSAAATSEYLLKQLEPPRAMFLLHGWSRWAMDARSNGFQPESEAIGERALKLKDMAQQLNELKAQANILGLCAKGGLSFDTLQEPHASMGARLSRTNIMGAISAGQGSALAFVSMWEEHIAIDAIAINPAYMIAGEEAEVVLLSHVVSTAREKGVEQVLLKPPYQVEGAAFYERAHFYPSSTHEGMLEYRPPAEAAPAAAAEGGAEPEGAVEGAAAARMEEAGEAAAALVGAPPPGFEWGGIF